MRSLNVNSLLDSEHPDEVRQTLKELIDEYSLDFNPLSPGEAVDTSVRTEIRTNTAGLIY